eukprot:TRINITY_DN3118_c0_g1_i4.p1 TRINITY_DN3118_c0_g1~~TRINITY_DN3118_c0_g1_i4.p1  ORF type:complete len:179 (+),score=23.04 TRINITY_DN3118_c0_g1_i4:119-655(+)
MQIVPPLEIEWVWFTHVIRPAKYHAYCNQRFGFIIDHNIDNFFKGLENKNLLDQTLQLYRDEYKEELIDGGIFEPDEIKYLETCDLYQDKEWYPKLANLPVYQNPEFLKESYQGYIQFMENIKLEGFKHGPIITIDLYWHSHQQRPLLYISDCMHNFNEIIYHMPIGSVGNWIDFPTL